MMTESARKVWREGIAHQISTQGLECLRDGLINDDDGLLQENTTDPPPLGLVQSWPVLGACAIGYCGWAGEGLNTVAEVEKYFADACYRADMALGEPAAVRHFMNWYDDEDRDIMRRDLLAEVERVLAYRHIVDIPEEFEPAAA